jgi:hypothetical protein
LDHSCFHRISLVRKLARRSTVLPFIVCLHINDESHLRYRSMAKYIMHTPLP